MQIQPYSQPGFITNIEGSADFCAGLLSYYEEGSSDDATVNGSVLLPADSTDRSPLSDDVEEEDELLAAKPVTTSEEAVESETPNEAIEAPID